MNTTTTAALHALSVLTRLDGEPDARERAALEAWPGWGALAGAFAPSPTGEWADAADQLDEILADHPAWHAAGLAATDTSFYTPTWLVDRMLQVLVSTGFTGGKVLEPGCGSGRFMAGRLPGAVWTGIESDPVSAAIAAAVHPDATILDRPLERVTLTDGSFEAAIGNVPFSPVAPYDPEVEASNLHGYFLARALRAVRPGGYVVAVTSRALFDNAGQTDDLLDLAELRAAVRLASGTFEATGAVADLLVLRRRGGEPAPVHWNDLRERMQPAGSYESRGHRRLLVEDEAGSGDRWRRPSVGVNRYWEVHPDHVAGRMVATGYDKAPLKVVTDDARGAGLAAIDAACTDLPEAPAPEGGTDAPGSFEDVTLADDQGRKEGSFHLAGDSVVRITGGSPVTVTRGGAELRALVALRDAVLELLEADTQVTHVPGDPNAQLRTAAREAYEAYARRFGPLNRGTLHEGALDAETGEPKWSWRRPLMGGFRRDPDYMTVMACEVYDPDTEQARPAAVLLRPVNKAPVPIERTETAAEALSVTLGERGRVDLDRIASLLGLPAPAEALDALGDLVYQDPRNRGAWLTARDYLSGDVREKLAIARAAGDGFERNARALAAILPPELGPLQIRASLGSPWIDADIVSEFARETFGGAARVTHTAALGVWEVDRSYSSQAAMLAYGTSRKSPYDLLDAALNGRSVTVTDEEYNPETRSYRKVRNAEATLAAESKLAAIQERFATWVWEDAERATALAAEFNRRFRSHVPRVSDGSGLTFPGLADDVELWPWQKNIVDRIASSPRTLCAHPVGAGKTLEMVASAITLRRLGLATKPLVAVPGHLLEQIAREAAQAFPAASFLVAGKDDIAGEGRRLFAARCATGDWDAVIMTHEVFGSIPVSPAAEERWVAQQKASLAEAIRSDEARSSRGRGAKAVATALRRLESRLGELRHAKNDPATVTFEQLGVDFLAVDELHLFKRLSIPTRQEGFSLGASKRATDLLLKVEVLGQRRGSRPHFAGFTGTPWSNTLAETFVWQKFFQPDRLVDAGLDSFDAWAAMFVRYETRVEVAPDGSGFRMNRRPVEVLNARALMGMFREVADLMDAADLPLVRPEARRRTLVAPASPQQAEFVTSLVVRADKLRSGGVSATDNMLVICNDGRRVALDPHLVGVGGEATKLDLVAETVAATYAQHAGTRYEGSEVPGALQLVLCDLGTPSAAGSQTYGRIKAALVARGVPSGQVRFVHEATSDKARAALFAACRSGAVSVLIGSTSKVGIGTNIQSRLAALHHVDAPWRPSDIEQREGRAIRHGNQNAVVDVFRYVTQGTFDAYMWQTLETKARFIHALLAADLDADTISDVGAQVLSFGEVKALAAGNPMLLEHAEARSAVRHLRVLRAMHLQSVGEASKSAKSCEHRAYEARRRCEGLLAAADLVNARPDGASDLDGAHRLAAAVTAARTSSWQTRSGSWCGLQVKVDESATTASRVVLDVHLSYRSIGSVTVARKALRGDGARALDRALARLVADAHGSAARARAEADRMDAQAEAASAAAESATFDREGDLTAAEERLAMIERAMQDEVTEPAAA